MIHKKDNNLWAQSEKNRGKSHRVSWISLSEGKKADFPMPYRKAARTNSERKVFRNDFKSSPLWGE
jgi:hypothetical protein